MVLQIDDDDLESYQLVSPEYLFIKRSELRRIVKKRVQCVGIIDKINYEYFNKGKYSKYIDQKPCGLFFCVVCCYIKDFGYLNHIWIRAPLFLENDFYVGQCIVFQGIVNTYIKEFNKKNHKKGYYGIDSIENTITTAVPFLKIE